MLQLVLPSGRLCGVAVALHCHSLISAIITCKLFLALAQPVLHWPLFFSFSLSHWHDEPESESEAEAGAG